MRNEFNSSRREFVKKAAYVAPAILTLQAAPALREGRFRSTTRSRGAGRKDQADEQAGTTVRVSSNAPLSRWSQRSAASRMTSGGQPRLLRSQLGRVVLLNGDKKVSPHFFIQPFALVLDPGSVHSDRVSATQR